MMRFVAEGQYQVRPEDLWPLVADTKRLNRAIGLQAVDFFAAPRSDGGSVVTGEYRKFGVTVARWTEHAFDFERPRRYSVIREYSAGPITYFKGGVDLTPLASGTAVRVYAEITPRNPLGWALVKLFVGPTTTSRVLAQCRKFEAYLLGRREEPFPELRPRRRAVDERRLDELMPRLRAAGAQEAIARSLRDYVKTASDDRVSHMRPFELADQWGTERRLTLVSFLQATTIGLLDMRWVVLCPNCRVSKAEHASLSELRDQVHCDVCNIRFDSNFDRLVEVCFKVSPTVRDANLGDYCMGGPQNMPHVVAQVELAPGESTQWTLPPGVSAFRVRSPLCPAALIDVADDFPSGHGEGDQQEATLVLEANGIKPPQVRVGSGSASVRVVSRLDAPTTVAVEERFWPDTAATAALVSTLQEFRDLFSAEVLAPGLQVGIERLALLFTDLAGSTALYERIGQARAFRLVHEHFGLIEDAVRANRGAVVKTIGDAVMAVFPAAAQAARCAIDMQRRMRSFDTTAAADPAQLLKIGIHVGPCVAVTLNNRLDYFGTAVNIAARINHEAGGGEVLLTDAVWSDSGVADMLAAEGVVGEPCEIQLRGIMEATRVFRIPGTAFTQENADRPGSELGLNMSS